MTRLRGHFDGRHIVLDEPLPPELRVNTTVEVVIPDAREQALRELETFLDSLWATPAPTVGGSRLWTREELHERGCTNLP